MLPERAGRGPGRTALGCEREREEPLSFCVPFLIAEDNVRAEAYPGRGQRVCNSNSVGLGRYRLHRRHR